ncbi:type I site-specific deoxyribonuclease, HsdR family [Thermodesulfobacterium geofontis OPF15]|uniref:Type I restriction enzyme endonuclease subunit n=1 Tax=Thermodesulfobacterium geofontis (strain OPF15) TaxID=795359 RepID=F8C2H7_THEGP|nr:type I restriction endonuclease subunit R [Thermodesulfobacterium geofontis]AEH22267.1 type I site-specific deoxyribonuclease, HsdR family [Thermodesulfobacterium geofontis OPF15]
MPYLTENYLVEKPAINWFQDIGYSYVHGSYLIPDAGERESYRHCILKRRFLNAIQRLNPWLTNTLAEEVYKRVIELDHPDFIIKGKLFYDLLTNGVKLTFKEGKEERTKIVKLIDFESIENNDFLIANQFKVEYQYEREQYKIPDLVVFINGIPIAVFELKSLNAEETAKDAFLDHQRKIKDIPQLYVYSQIIVASDGYETKYGSPTSDWERFFVWEGMLSDDDVEVEEIADGYYKYIYNGKEITSLELLIKGLFRKEHILEFINDFVFYEKDGETYKKKIAGYHQFYTVKKAIQRTIDCVLYGKTPEEKRIGVVWHTQGSGKSLTMLFYAKKALKVKELENPLLIFITDRRELDEQLYKLFSQFSNAKQAESIKDLQETIRTIEGSIIFTTIQKFGKRKAEEYPFLTERKNIIVIADEAHRSQYRELAQNLRKAIPNASFMGFTATPIELQDRDTYLVFGEPISVYPMDKALRHKIIVPIYYEPRLAELHLTNEFIDEEFEELSEGLEPELKEHLKKKYARLEELILNQERLEKIAKDIVEHFNKRVETLEGKGMIVVISRKVAVELYKAIKKIPNAPSIEVVISGNKQRDPEDYHPFIRKEKDLEDLLNNFKNPEKDPKIVIVVDMLLTGFDVPCLHTMYFDKPMKNHSLIQAIARVNRVFKDKPAGLIVDYIGIADDLRKSLSQYTLSAINQVLTNINEVIDVLKEKYDIVSSMFYGLNYQNWKRLKPEELAQLTVTAYNLLHSEDLKKKFIKNYLALKKAYALASPHLETIKIKDDIMFFEMIKKMIVKYSSTSRKEISRELEYEISQLISRSISAEEPVDIFSLIKKDKPDISILNEELLSKIANLAQKNYAVDLLMKLIKDEIKTRIRINPYRYKSLYERLQKLIEMYNIKLISTVDVINELIEIAKEIKKKLNEGKELDLTEEELAFYDMLLKEGVFRNKEEIIYVVKEIKKTIGTFVKIVDWNKKETLRARIKVAIKEILAKVLEMRVGYEKINKITSEIYEQIEMLHAA